MTLQVNNRSDSSFSVLKIEKEMETNRKWCRHAYQLIWFHSFTVSWDGFADGWQAASLGPHFGTQVTEKVKASGNGEEMLNKGMKYWQLLSINIIIGHQIPHRWNNGSLVIWSFKSQKLVLSMMIRCVLISEVSLIPGRIVHVLQNSPNDPLQLFPRSLLLL